MLLRARVLAVVASALTKRFADVPIVISDIDGTITRSDLPGMFLPYVGRDWSQIGGMSVHVCGV